MSIVYRYILAIINLEGRQVNLFLLKCIGKIIFTAQKIGLRWREKWKSTLNLILIRPSLVSQWITQRVMFFHQLHRHVVRFDDFSLYVRIVSSVRISHCVVRLGDASLWCPLQWYLTVLSTVMISGCICRYWHRSGSAIRRRFRQRIRPPQTDGQNHPLRWVTS